MRFSLKYALVIAGLAVSALCAADGGHAPRTTHQDLIGAWRLMDIDVEGPAGREPDLFYGSDSRGLLIYDASGWFSVQIEGSRRPAVKVPPARPVLEQSESSTRLDAAALNSYYAYYGTWSFDAATSTVTHHAKGALYPSEDEAIYPQHVEVVGRRMTFTRTQNGKVQTKRWERVSGD
ncbi:MAG TPA: lipocalin-like domain-containing protein [Steroidobacteraceae bacterium]|nr:lipocalin-like domain-containing protein [Steroidobacteraceae bacterium]